MRVLFAIDNTYEQQRFRKAIKERNLSFQVFVPDTINDLDQELNSHGADVIITDLHFQSGGFAEWLFLWNHPFILLAEWDEYERVAELVHGQFSEFVIRSADLKHIDHLPLVVQRLLANVESIQRQNYELKMTETRYRELVQALPDIIYTLDPEGRFLFVNDSVRRLGWDPVELIGKHFSVLLDPEDVERVSRESVLPKYQGRSTGPQEAPKLFDERRTGDRRTQDLEIHLRRKGDQEVSGRVVGQVIAYGEVSAVGFQSVSFGAAEPGSAGIIRDITHRKESQRLLELAVKENQTLLLEIHHRIKNNLQVISSLLNLHALEVDDSLAKTRLGDAQMQIQSIATVHEQLYRSEKPAAVDSTTYIDSLTEQILEIYRVDPARIRIETEIESIAIPIRQATPVALLLTELVVNCLKHAFGQQDGTGLISVSLSRLTGQEPPQVRLVIADNGVGLPEGFDLRQSKTLGHNLVWSLTQQLNGTIETGSDRGSRFVITFPVDPLP